MTEVSFALNKEYSDDDDDVVIAKSTRSFSKSGIGVGSRAQPPLPKRMKPAFVAPKSQIKSSGWGEIPKPIEKKPVEVVKQPTDTPEPFRYKTNPKPVESEKPSNSQISDGYDLYSNSRKGNQSNFKNRGRRGGHRDNGGRDEKYDKGNGEKVEKEFRVHKEGGFKNKNQDWKSQPKNIDNMRNQTNDDNQSQDSIKPKSNPKKKFKDTRFSPYKPGQVNTTPEINHTDKIETSSISPPLVTNIQVNVSESLKEEKNTTPQTDIKTNLNNPTKLLEKKEIKDSKPPKTPKPSDHQSKKERKFKMFADSIQNIEREEIIDDIDGIASTTWELDPTIISPQLKNALRFLCPLVNEDSTESDIRSIPQLRLEMLAAKGLNPINYRAIRSFCVDPIVADFLAECFAVNLDISLIGIAGKFSSAPAGLRLMLPAQVPVSFTLARGEVQLSFFDTPGVCGVEVEGMIKYALDTFHERSMIIYTLGYVSNDFLSPSVIHELSSKYKTAALITPPKQNQTGFSYRIYFMDMKWDEQTKKNLNTEIMEIYNRSMLYQCRQCKKFYRHGDESKCEEKYHPGTQIPFQSGEMIEKSIENDTMIQKVRYSCCGECSVDDPGCAIRLNPAHLDDESISKMFVEEKNIL